MGWLKRRKDPEVVEIAITGDVVGESRYMHNIADVVAFETGAPANPAGGEVLTSASVVAEVNPRGWSPYAVAVKRGSLHLGYLPCGSVDSRGWAALRDAGALEVRVRIGWGPRMSFGVTIIEACEQP